MTIQDKHLQSKSASQTPNSEKLRKNARGIDEKTVSADREQLSNLDVNSATPGTQPRWETGSTGSPLATPSAATAGHHGGDKGERHDGRAADINGWTGEDPSQRTDRLPDRGDQNVQLDTSGSSNTQSGSNTDSSLRSKASDVADDLKEKAGDLKNKAGDLMSNSNSGSNDMKSKAEDFKNKAGHVAQDARDSANRAGQAVHEQYRTGARKAKQQASQVRSRISDTIDQNPLALVAIGIGIGAALGLLLPSTRREDRIMGAQRDRLKGQLMDASAQQLRQARQQLEETH
ncbi:hypothetical protein [Allohahella marinimesophila]|uniref:ElaB/YqjD/DUF883 family membrane-anchored ribosome-binding protein n=1 Tax=Allohahella marinimesophila TaxID=1054972 RepID=A0ABP7PQY7_9GAMM